MDIRNGSDNEARQFKHTFRAKGHYAELAIITDAGKTTATLTLNEQSEDTLRSFIEKGDHARG